MAVLYLYHSIRLGLNKNASGNVDAGSHMWTHYHRLQGLV